MAIYPVIMCGGMGTRLWPESQPNKPKQFAPLMGELSMFQETVLRVAIIGGTAKPVVVGGAGHRRLIAEQLAAIGVSAVVLLEPEGRDSAPAMAAACAWIASQDKDGVAVVVAADHHIPDGQAFRDAVSVAVDSANSGQIVTFGVRPSTPSTAYGYISPGEARGPVWAVRSFVEKPDLETAKSYVAQGYLWNSGNFVVRAATLLEELNQFDAGIVRAAQDALGDQVGAELLLGEAFRTSRRISIDYAVMEKTARASVLPVDFAWSDLGAWDAVWSASPKDERGNAVRGEAVAVDSSDCLVRANGLQVALVGVRDLAIVADEGRLLVARLSESQKVKEVVGMLEGAAESPAGAPAGGFTNLKAVADWFDQWLKTSALPLWWSLGADHVGGGYFEALSPVGKPLEGPRRSRVQTRQVYTFASAGMLGWKGPWRQAAWHGMDYFLARYRRPDGLFRASVSPHGEPLDETARLYDQAFALLAMATLQKADPGHVDLASESDQLFQAIQSLRHPLGGFREEGDHPFQANAHMHLFEAAMAGMEAGGGAHWEALGHEIVDLALSRFIDPEGGFLREFFNPDWTPASGADGRHIEPGHQFEWAWLLSRWEAQQPDPRIKPAVARLFAAGVRGAHAADGVVCNSLFDDFTPKDASARLWPQTEYLKAALELQKDEHVLRAASALRLYLDTPAVGAWRDRRLADGAMVEEPCPASSFYHIMAACLMLDSSADPASE